MYSTTEMAKKLGVSTQTLRNWDKEKKLVANRTPTNRMFYTHEQYLEISGKVKYKKTGQDVDAIIGKTVLITGGTGSLGNALTQHICDYAKKVIIYSRDELKQANMQQKFADKNNIRYFLGDVKDKDRLKTALKGVDICIHAACYKRIEFCSYNPSEAVKNNIIGSVNVAEACIENKVQKVIMVSTDKACESATLYGGTKFVSEQIFTNANNYSSRDGTILSSVRYGNVYGSRGSIRHLFDKQVKEDGIISITHEEMTRFFMSISDACDLVLYCANNMIGGEIFIPKMKSIQISEYAKSLYPNIPQKIIGLRGHEKIHEKLISETEENFVVKCNDKYYKIVPPPIKISGVIWDINYPDEKREQNFTLSSRTADRLSKEEIENFEKDFV